jgi:predicted DNA-binding transcriptional regulator AlpA
MSVLNEENNKALATIPQMLFTIPQTETILNMGHTSIYRAISKGFIRADGIVRLGRSIRITRAEVERLAREGWGE